MPRGPRLDAPAALHHVMARGIERRPIFVTERDRVDFLGRLDRIVEDGALRVFAFALMPNHFHLLARTGNRPIGRAMSSLLTGYAVSFNRRHDRVGHLFQNRFKSVLCEEDGYFRELVRYIHLNPVRAGIVAGLDELDRDATTGHAAILGRRPARFLDVGHVLGAFGADRDSARRGYRAFIAEGLDERATSEATRRGNVLMEVVELAERTRRKKFHGLVLGSDAFKAAVRRDAARAPGEAPAPRVLDRRWSIDALIAAIAAATGVSPSALLGARRLQACCVARGGVAYLWLDRLGGRAADVAAALSVSEVSVYRAAARGRADPARWIRALESEAARATLAT